EPADPLARELDPGRVVPGVLELAHLATDDDVPGAVVAADVDSPDIDPPARIDHDREAHRLLLAIEFGHGVDVRERIAELAEAPGDRLGGGRQLCTREDIALLEFDQLGE